MPASLAQPWLILQTYPNSSAIVLAQPSCVMLAKKGGLLEPPQTPPEYAHASVFTSLQGALYKLLQDLSTA